MRLIPTPTTTFKHIKNYVDGEEKCGSKKEEEGKRGTTKRRRGRKKGKKKGREVPMNIFMGEDSNRVIQRSWKDKVKHLVIDSSFTNLFEMIQGKIFK